MKFSYSVLLKTVKNEREMGLDNSFKLSIPVVILQSLSDLIKTVHVCRCARQATQWVKLAFIPINRSV